MLCLFIEAVEGKQWHVVREIAFITWSVVIKSMCWNENERFATLLYTSLLLFLECGAGAAESPVDYLVQAWAIKNSCEILIKC